MSGRGYPVDQASLLTHHPGRRVERHHPAAPETAGCAAADYGTKTVTGAIAVVDDTGCSIVDKQNTAVAEGAVGLLVVSAPGSGGSPKGLFTPGYYQRLKVPVGVIDDDADAALRRTDAPVRLTLDAKAAMVKSRNVVAQTRTGTQQRGDGRRAPGRREAPASTTTAPVWPHCWKPLRRSARSRRSPTPSASGSGGPRGWRGSTKYVAGLDRDQLNDIALYLNFDMLGSPNAGFFTYDGDQSGQPNPDVPWQTVPTGPAGSNARWPAT